MATSGPSEKAVLIVLALDISGCSYDELLSNLKYPRQRYARRLACALLREFTTISYPDLAETMGRNRSGHSSVIHWEREGRELPEFPAACYAARQRLNARLDAVRGAA